MRPALVLLVAVLTAAGLGAQGWDGAADQTVLPATAEARLSDLSRGLAALTPVERLQAGAWTDPSGTKISARIVRKGSGEYLLWELRWEPGAACGAGTWVAFRDGLGRLRELRIILLEGSEAGDLRVAQPGTWVRLVPQKSGSRLDLFLAGRLVTGGWAVPGDLLAVLGSPDRWLWETTAEHLEWASLLPVRRWEDEKVEALRTEIHKKLSTMPAAPSTLWVPAAQGSLTGTAANGSPWGQWELLPGQEGHAGRGLGPWGVTHWAAVGVIRGWKGPFPPVESLLEPRIELPGYSRALVPENLADDPAFALDWIRNLGLAAEAVIHPQRPRTDASADVQGLPFLEPVPGAGFAVDEAPALWHLLAVNRPGTLYLASLSTQTIGAKGASSSVVFRAPALVLPWIGADQRLRVAVYAGPKEQSWAEWLAAYPQDRRGVRPDHLAVVALPLPPSVALPVLPAR